MSESKNIRLCKKLLSVINEFFDQEELTYVKVYDLEEMFYNSLSSLLQHSFDIQVSKEKLNSLGHANEFRLAQFIVETIENDKTYIMLNYLLSRFIQSYFFIAKKDKKDNVIQIILKEGLKVEDLQSTIDQYQKFVTKNKMHSQKIQSL